MDDNLSSGSEIEVARMKGECVKEEGGFVYNGTVSQILKKTFSTSSPVKCWATDGIQSRTC